MQRIIYFDIDDTLVRSFGQKRIPMPSVISQIRRLKKMKVAHSICGVRVVLNIAKRRRLSLV
jgi:hydroxymethylpyrimidine pyrophosphatase-like HAD family hydrolase